MRIFISSPGDVGEERELTALLIKRLQREFSARLEINPFFWEHQPLRATSSFQEEIDGLLRPSQADIVILILWSRLGTRLSSNITRPDGSRYDSGTEYEFEDAVQGHQQRGLPDILVYRKTAKAFADLSLSDQEYQERREQKKLVDGFIDHWFKGADGSFTSSFLDFASPAEFEEKLEQHLRALIQKRLPEKPHIDQIIPRPPVWQGESPFRGLEPFDFSHAPIFCGRTQAVSEILQALRRQAQKGSAFVMVMGMSGGGKSSLVRAGVLPRLTQPGVIEGIGLWRRSIFRPSDAGGDLLAGLALALLQETALPLLPVKDPAELALHLRKSPETVIDLALPPELARLAVEVQQAEKLSRPPEARLVLLADQLEEIFTQEKVTSVQRREFIRALAALARSGRVWVLATMRSDFFARCQEVPELMELKQGEGQYDLRPPQPAEIAQMIRQPAAMAGLVFEEQGETPGRLDDVLRDAAIGSPESLPLLEFTLEELYKLSVEDQEQPQVLTFRVYEALGGLEGAIARRADAVFSALPAAARDEALDQVLANLVSLGLGEKDSLTAVRAPLDQVAATPAGQALVQAFVAARLFVTDTTDDGRPVVGLAHEALLRHWGQARDWVEKNRSFLRTRSRIITAASLWQEQGELASLLLPPGKPLAEAQEVLRQYPERLAQREISYIEASGRQARRSKRRRRFWYGLTAATLMMLISSGLWYWRETNKELSHHFAVSLFAKGEEALKNKEFNKAILYNLNALQFFNHNLHSREELLALGNIYNNPYYPLISSIHFPTDKIDTIETFKFINDECIEIANHKNIVKFDLVNKKIFEHRILQKSYNVSPDNKYYYLKDLGDVAISVYDSQTKKEIITISKDGCRIKRIIFSHDSKTLAIGFSKSSTEKFISVWDLASEKEQYFLSVKNENTSWGDLIFSSDDSILASAGAPMSLWDMKDGKLIATSNCYGDQLCFSPDNKLIAAVAEYPNDVIIIWDISSNKIKRLDTKAIKSYKDILANKNETEINEKIKGLNFSKDGRKLVSWGKEDNVRIWDCINGSIETVLDDFGPIWGASFSPNGKVLATLSKDSSINLWCLNADDNYFIENSSLITPVKDWISFSSNKDNQGEVCRARFYIIRESEWHWHHSWVPWVFENNFFIMNDIIKGYNVNFPKSKLSILGKSDGKITVGNTKLIVSAPDEKSFWGYHNNFFIFDKVKVDGKYLTKLCIFKDGNIIIAHYGDEVKIINLITNEEWHIKANEIEILSNKLILSLFDGKSTIWNLFTKNKVDIPILISKEEGGSLLTQDERIAGIGISPDENYLVLNFVDQSQIWNIKDNKLVVNIARGISEISKDFKYIAYFEYKILKILEVNSGKEISQIDVNKLDIDTNCFLCFSPDSNRLAASSCNGNIYFIETNTGKILATLQGNHGKISELSFSPDGSLLASGDSGNIIRLWDGKTGVPRAIFCDYRERGESPRVAFLGDGNLYVEIEDKNGKCINKILDMSFFNKKVTDMIKTAEQQLNMSLKGNDLIKTKPQSINISSFNIGSSVNH